MKKELLLSAALFYVFASSSQNRQIPANAGMVNMAEKYAHKFNVPHEPKEINNTVKPSTVYTAENQHKKQPAGPIVWNSFSGSMNVLGVLESSGKPLQYNNELNAVAFIHRKSPSYPLSPAQTATGAISGGIVAQLTSNWGNTWDSTLIWNNGTNWARYPQGGIYNPPGNTVLTNAYVIASGPTTHANSDWMGNYIASKSLNVMSNVASTVTGAQQFFPNLPPYDPGIEKMDYPSFDFTTTDDGMVRSLGIIVNNFNSTAAGPDGRGFRGARVAKGTFNAGTFVWTNDSVIPDVLVNSNTLSKSVINEPHMAWNDSGTVGYVWFVGCRTGATGNNAGFQPIVYQSVNGSPWTLIPGINFNDTAKFNKPVLSHLLPVRLDTTKVIPFFNFVEGMDCTVDKNNRLHIMAAILGTAKNHADSLGFTWSNFPNWDGETYAYPHGPGQHPYLYDFYMSGNTNADKFWNVAEIAAMTTEAPGERPTDDGFADNPWSTNPDNGNKVASHARLQMSRTPGGSKIIYTWAESDTGVTNNGRKWNHLPNVHVKMMDINASISHQPYSIFPVELNVTSFAGANPYVKDRGAMHHISPKSAFVNTLVASSPGGTKLGFTIKMPITVSNGKNTPMIQVNPVTHWFSAAEMDFYDIVDGINENARVIESVNIFPNPATGTATLKLKAERYENMAVNIHNVTGQIVIHQETSAIPGDNEINLDLKNLPAGIYIVNIKSGDRTASKKLVIE